MYKIQIIEESEERMVARFCIYDVVTAYMVIIILLAISVVALQYVVSKDTYGLLILVPVFFLAAVLVSYSEGRLLNILCIDKKSGTIVLKRVGPWLPGKKTTCKINQISELCFVQSDYSMRTDKFLIFVMEGEEHLLEKRWRPMWYKMVFRDLWWPVYKKMPEDILEKHRKIANYLGVPYRRRLVTLKGYKEEIE
jgi:hypothetical protein